MPSDPRTLRIPKELLPADGRFGSGPSRVRDAQVDAFESRAARAILGTSHRQPPVRALVGRVRDGMRHLFHLPDGHEVILGVGGATAFWDVAAYGLIERRSAHAVHGAFSSKFARAVAQAPHLAAPLVAEAAAGSRAELDGAARDATDAATIDTWAVIQNETSTGVAAPIRRPRNAAGKPAAGITLIDATSSAGCTPFDASESDAYYFSPQKAFGADGGIWFALLSPDGIARAESIAASKRKAPPSLNLVDAITESRRDQTVNTPAIGSLLLLAEQVDWLNAEGGLAWSSARCAESSGRLYAWAESRPWASPFVQDPTIRSKSVATIEFDAAVDAAIVREVLGLNGIVDLHPYQSIGGNGIRVGAFPSVDPDEISALTACIDWVVERL
ncbi:MAG: hypothetical protein RIR19_158 [Chloroflexota bacterium]|jgi:phosphoserine aminotransferase